MIINQKVQVIEKIVKDWNMDGRTGTALKARVLIGMDVFRLNTTKEILDQLENGKTYNVAISVTTNKEEPKFELVEVLK